MTKRSFARYVLSLVSITAAAALLASAVAIAGWVTLPRLFGLVPVTVASSSMEPGIAAGDLLFFEPEFDKPVVGRVVLFPAPSSGDLTSHRVYKIPDDGTVITKGDANAEPDSDPVPIDTIEGVAILRMPKIGSESPALVAGIALTGGLSVAALAWLLRRGPRAPSGRRRRAARAVAASAVVVGLVAGVAATADAALIASTSNASNSWATVFTPNQVLSPVTSPAAAVPDLRIAGTVYSTVEHQGVVYFAGDFSRVAGTARTNLAAWDLTSGSLTAWDPQPNTSATGTPGVFSMAVDTVNKTLYVGGTFTTISGVARSRIAAYDISTPATPVLLSWAPAVNSIVRAVAVDQTTNNVYAGGDFTNVGSARNRLAMWSAVTSGGGGVLDATFAPSVPNNGVFAIAINATNIFFGGSFTSMWGSGTQNRLAAANKTTGAQLGGFTANAGGSVFALAIGGGGTLWAGGAFTTIGGAARTGIAQLSPTTGVQDVSVNRPISAGQVNTLTYDSSRDFMYVGGTFTALGSVARNRVAVVPATTATGSVGVPLGWNPNAQAGVNVTQTLANPAPTATATAVFSIAVVGTAAGTADVGAAVIGGNFTVLNDTERQSLAVTEDPPVVAVSNNQPLATDVDVGVTGQINASVQVGTTLYIGGNFTWVNGQPRSRLAAIDTTTGALLPWAPAVTAPGGASTTVPAVHALAAYGGYIYVGGIFTTIGGVARTNFAVVDGSTAAVTAFSQAFSGGTTTVLALAVDPINATLYLGGSFTTTPRSRLAAYSLAAPAVPTLNAWNPAANGTVRAFAVDPVTSEMYVGGDFTNTSATAKNRIAAYSPVIGGTGGVLDATFTASVTANSVFSLALAPNPDPITASPTLYIGGSFTNITGPGPSGGARSRIAAAATVDGSITAWNPNASSTVAALDVAANGDVYAGGNFTTIGGGTRSRLAVLDPAAGTAYAWTPVATLGSGSISTVTLDANVTDRVWAGGDIRATMTGAVDRESLVAVDGPAAGPATIVGWDLPTAAPNGVITDMVTASGYAYIGGTFRYVMGQRRLGVAQIDLTTNTPTSWDANLTSPTLANQPSVLALTTDSTETRLYVGGDFFTTAGGASRTRFAVFNIATGLIDPTFTSAVSGPVRDIEVDSTGLVYLAGDFTGANAVGTLTRTGLARVLADGTPDAAFTVSLSGIGVYDIALTGDDSTLYMGGNFIGFSTPVALRNRTAAVLTAGAGSLAAWNPNVTTAASIVQEVALSNDELSVYLGGTFTSVNNAAVATAGGLAVVDASSGTSTVSLAQPGTANVRAVLETGGLLVVGGTFTTLGGSAVTRIGGVDPVSGSAISSFAPIIDGSSAVNALGTAPGGDLLLAGQFYLPNSNDRGGFARIQSTAVTVVSFSTPVFTTASIPTVTAPVVVNASLLVDDTLFLGGTFTAVNDQPRRRLASVNAVDGSLGAVLPGVDLQVMSLAVAPGSTPTAGTLYVGGQFTIIHTPAGVRSTRNRLAGVDLATGGVTSFNPNVGSGDVRALAVLPSTGVVYAGGGFTTAVQGATRNRLASFTSTGTLTAWNPNLNSTVTSFALNADASTLYVGGSFATVGGATTRNRLASFTTATGALTSFDPNMGNAVRALVISDETTPVLYVGGDFLTVGGSTARTRAAAFDEATGALTAWDPAVADGGVYALAEVKGGSVYLAGTFTLVNTSVLRNRIAGVSRTTGAVSTFDPGALSTSVLTLACDATLERLAAAGNFTTFGGQARTSLALMGP